MQFTNYLLTGGLGRISVEFHERGSVDSWRFQKEVRLGQAPCHQWGSPGGKQIRGHEASTGLEVCKNWGLCADSIDVIDVESDTEFSCEGEKVKDSVGRAPRCRDRSGGIFEGGTADETSEGCARLQEFHDVLTG